MTAPSDGDSLANAASERDKVISIERARKKRQDVQQRDLERALAECAQRRLDLMRRGEAISDERAQAQALRKQAMMLQRVRRSRAPSGSGLRSMPAQGRKACGHVNDAGAPDAPLAAASADPKPEVADVAVLAGARRNAQLALRTLP